MRLNKKRRTPAAANVAVNEFMALASASHFFSIFPPSSRFQFRAPKSAARALNWKFAATVAAAVANNEQKKTRAAQKAPPTKNCSIDAAACECASGSPTLRPIYSPSSSSRFGQQQPMNKWSSAAGGRRRARASSTATATSPKCDACRLWSELTAANFDRLRASRSLCPPKTKQKAD